MGGAETGRDIPISLEGAGLGTRCPTVTSGGCCAWANLLCSPPARWFVQSEPGFVRPARRRVPARHKFSAWARFKAGDLIPASAASMQPLTCWLQRNCSPLCSAASTQPCAAGTPGFAPGGQNSRCWEGSTREAGGEGRGSRGSDLALVHSLKSRSYLSGIWN